MIKFFTAKKINTLVLLAILAIASWSYLTCLGSGLVDWDDQFQISNNLDIKYFSIGSLPKIFTTFYAGMYQPLATLTFALENKFWHSFPLFLHLDNLLLHLLNVLLVYWLTKKLFYRSSVALMAAAAFALHPIQTETVAWVSARSNLLYAGFSLLAVIAYIAYCQKTSVKKYLITLTCFVLALLSKAPAVILPVVLIALDYYYRRPLNKKTILEKIPLFLLSLIFGWLAVNGRDLDKLIPPAVYSWPDKLAFAAYSPLSYLQKIILPYNLSPFYALPDKVNDYLPIIFYLSIPLCLLAIGLIVRYRRNRKLVLGSAWFLLLLLPSIQFKTFSTTLMADRYVYLAGLGIFWLLSLAILALWKNLKKLKIFIILAVLIIFAFLTAQTKSQTGVWRDSVSLWTKVIDSNPKSTDAYINLGNAKSNNNDIAGATEAYQQALAIDKNNYFVYNNLGVMLSEKIGNQEEAINYYNQAIKLNPDEALFYYNRATALAKLNRLPEALQNYQMAVTIKSNETFYSYSYLNSLASLEYRLGYLAEAEQHYTQIINNEPQLADPYFFRGLTRIKLNNLPLACRDLEQADRLGYPDSDQNLQISCH